MSENITNVPPSKERLEFEAQLKNIKHSAKKFKNQLKAFNADISAKHFQALKNSINNAEIAFLDYIFKMKDEADFEVFFNKSIETLNDSVKFLLEKYEYEEKEEKEEDFITEIANESLEAANEIRNLIATLIGIRKNPIQAEIQTQDNSQDAIRIKAASEGKFQDPHTRK